MYHHAQEAKEGEEAEPQERPMSAKRYGRPLATLLCSSCLIAITRAMIGKCDVETAWTQYESGISTAVAARELPV